MKASATKHGIDKFIYPTIGNQLTLVDQTGCKYNNTVEATTPEQDRIRLQELKMEALEDATLNIALESKVNEEMLYNI